MTLTQLDAVIDLRRLPSPYKGEGKGVRVYRAYAKHRGCDPKGAFQCEELIALISISS
jgi:hypothetical protein